MRRFLTTILLVCLLAGCGGGGGGGSPESTPVDNAPDSNSEPDPTEILLLDSVPARSAPSIDAGSGTFNFAHLAQSDLNISLDGDCADLRGNTLRRSLLDVAGTEVDEIIDHHVSCSLEENASYQIDANGTRSSDARFQASLAFSTGTSASTSVTVQDSVSIPQSAINDLFQDYVEGALISELEVPGLIESLIIDLVTGLAEANWGTLTDPDPLYAVVAERITYSSRSPSGAPSDNLSGLVARPVTGDGFTPRDRFIILTHATGSTPGDLNAADAWFILANMFASRGYLVVAADNYGRGASSDQEETYLMANRTAYNTLDLARRVLNDSSYANAYSGNEAAVIGYSQGGHSAIAVWLMHELQASSGIDISLVYAGGAPHNLYQTVRGVLRHIDGSCGDAFCEYVDDETTVPFATERILPALFAYTNTGLSLNEVVTDDTITDAFISGFLANDAEYDTIKSLLQLNSFTNISNANVLSASNAIVHLYHSDYDRLVPAANTDELAAILEASVGVDYHQNHCNSEGYEAIFNLTDRVGVVHTLCGLSVLDDAMQDLQ